MKKYILILLLLPNIILGQDELNLIDAIKIGIWKNYEVQINLLDSLKLKLEID